MAWVSTTPENDAEAPVRRPMVLARPQDRVFWIGFSVAALLHVAMIVGIAQSSSSRQMGERDGDPDAMTVDVIDASELPGKPVQPTPPAPKQASIPPAPQPQPPQEQVTPAPPTPPAPPVEATPPEPAPKAMKKAAPMPAEKEGLFPPTAPAESQPTPPKAQRRPQQPAQPQHKSGGPLSMAIPDVPIFGNSAGVGRPADITRSGENDEFGRGVVRALRKTMPDPDGITGRVTIRLLLTQTGNIEEAQLVRSGGNSKLDQLVVFAARQSSFPIPPANSTKSDRTFLVTYVYH